MAQNQDRRRLAQEMFLLKKKKRLRGSIWPYAKDDSTVCVVAKKLMLH